MIGGKEKEWEHHHHEKKSFQYIPTIILKYQILTVNFYSEKQMSENQKLKEH